MIEFWICVPHRDLKHVFINIIEDKNFNFFIFNDKKSIIVRNALNTI